MRVSSLGDRRNLADEPMRRTQETINNFVCHLLLLELNTTVSCCTRTVTIIPLLVRIQRNAILMLSNVFHDVFNGKSLTFLVQS